MVMRGTACWVLAAAIVAGGCAGRRETAVYRRLEVTPPVSASFAIVGDLQDTAWVEELIGREDNDDERAMMIAHIAQRRPAMILALGDLVFSGQCASAWRDFDRVMEPVAGVPIVAVAGNHDWYRRSQGDAINAGFRDRFLPKSNPETWHEHRVGALAILVVDSNLDKLGAEARGVQSRWFVDRLRKLDEDDTVRGVMVAVHHPRYTNGVGAGVGDWSEGMASFGEAFDGSRKAFVMVSGHTHTYERFTELTDKGSKHYLVSGGGGGPRRAVRPRTGKHRDQYEHPGEEGALEVRPFNLLWVSQEARGLRVQVTGLEKGADEFARMEELRLPWPK